jgi:hypothetical protein
MVPVEWRGRLVYGDGDLSVASNDARSILFEAQRRILKGFRVILWTNLPRFDLEPIWIGDIGSSNLVEMATNDPPAGTHMWVNINNIVGLTIFGQPQINAPVD